MKYLMILLFSLLCLHINAQTLKEDKVDDFTKNSIKRTSWEMINRTTQIYGHVRASKINHQVYIDLKLMFNGGQVVGIKEGPQVMLKMKTDSIVTLTNPKHTVACIGCGSINIIGSAGYGVELNMPIDNELMNYLLLNNAVKIRIYTTDGYIESEIKEKFQNSIKRVLELVK